MAADMLSTIEIRMATRWMTTDSRVLPRSSLHEWQDDRVDVIAVDINGDNLYGSSSPASKVKTVAASASPPMHLHCATSEPFKFITGQPKQQQPQQPQHPSSGVIVCL